VAAGRSRDDEEVRARYVGFYDGNASNFLIVYVRSRVYVRDVDKLPTTAWKGRITKQGLRDLNYYGPRAGKGVAGATVANETITPEAPPPVISSTGAHDEGAIK